jgi:EAL domain-containing protein (putative c-di-GMP-specific phosphodiesterase class I)/CheY-like chemotaxis protein
MTPLRVVVADDQRDVREALAELLSTDVTIEVVGLASNALEAIAECATLRPDVVIMDVKMPGGGGAKATRIIRQRDPRARVVAFSAYEDRQTVLEMLSAGAIGFVTKGSPAADIIAAVHRAADGKGLLSPAASAELVHELAGRLRADETRIVARDVQIERVNSAIRRGVSMVFQPIVDLRTDRIAGIEALARFEGTEPRAPDVWFAEAAELDLGAALEHAALEGAFAILNELPDDMFLSVNISPKTMVEPGFWDGIPPAVTSRLVIELTEHAAVHDYEQLRSVLAPLREQGARLAIDDAGAGFASLRHILLLGANFIKIDASITHDLHVHRPRRALAAALVSFAKETDAAVIAEGIEQPDELDAIRELGTAFAQGYLLGAPAHFEDLHLEDRPTNGGVRQRVSHPPR